jgi:hypothetical protein
LELCHEAETLITIYTLLIANIYDQQARDISISLPSDAAKRWCVVDGELSLFMFICKRAVGAKRHLLS